MRLLNHNFLIFLRKTVSCSIVAVPIYSSTKTAQWFPFLHNLSTFYYWVLVYISQSFITYVHMYVVPVIAHYIRKVTNNNVSIKKIEDGENECKSLLTNKGKV